MNKNLNKWNEDQKKNLDGQFEMSFMLRHLLHLVGDIHQPLHAAALFSNEFPKGDDGGNLFKINYSESVTNLHKLYDSLFEKSEDIKRVYIFNKAN
mgnify:CR=1 FL=1